MKKNNISKMAIIVIFLVAFTVLMVNLNRNELNPRFNTGRIASTTVTPSPTTSFKINLKGPWKCFFYDKETSISAVIKDRHLKVEMEDKKTTSKFLFKDDCLYRWEKNKFYGERICGLGQIVSVIDTVSNLAGGIDMNNLINYLPQAGFDQSKINLIKGLDIEKGCRQENPDEKVFILPTNVIFQDKVAVTSPPVKNKQ
jgi:hypothetical protein